jgi:hypothetical protein
MPTNPIVIEDAEPVREEASGFRVRVRDREVFIGRLQLPPGRLPPPVGLRGHLVLFREAAWALGLVPRPAPDAAGLPETPVVLADVLVTAADRDGVLVCVSEGRRFLLLPAHAMPGMTVDKPGDRGQLVIPRWLARDLGLLSERKAPPSGMS